jgi:drug/metabolite transporter (DMT)-like permease
MIGVVGGVFAALLWGASGVAAARSSRLIGAEVALAWVWVVGLLATLPAAAAWGLPDAKGSALGWAAIAAPAAVISIYLMYAALRRGPVVLVMPLTAAQGGLAALLAVALGEQLSRAAAVGLVLMMLGMYAVIRRPGGPAGTAAHPAAALTLAALCAVISAVALYASARAGGPLGPAWLLLILRATGVLGLALPLRLAGRLHWPGDATRFVVFSGLADTSAFASYVIAADHGGVAVPAVLSSQFAAVSVVIGVLTMGERLTRAQLAGVVTLLGAVALVTAAQR